MNTKTYTNKQAMDKFGLTSRAAFYHFKRKHPEAFVVLNQSTASGDVTQYDKQALDKFLEAAKSLRG
ncbi:MAG TPA: hypothetical protein VK897_00605 [Anaerolineales bacterium]|nr:hypothetical protein [Anaerolineales bacterium]